MLSYATYFWLKFPHVQEKVLDELASVELQNGRLPLCKLENLPYFVRLPLPVSSSSDVAKNN